MKCIGNLKGAWLKCKGECKYDIFICMVFIIIGCEMAFSDLY